MGEKTINEMDTNKGKNEDENDNNALLYYFAIGSMMNPISMKMRDVIPRGSWPGEIMDYRLNFFGKMGVGEAVHEKGASFHGVVHLVDTKTMKKLDEVEMGYDRADAKARLYDGTVHDVTVYTRSGEARFGETKIKMPVEEDLPPTQRYIDIMVDGAKHFGVDESHINYLRSVKTQPRVDPSEFKSYGDVPEGSPTITLDELSNNKGVDGKPLWSSINGKVKEYIGERDSDDWNRTLHMVQKFGQVEEIFLSRLLYDPKYGVPDTPKDFTDEHRACIEDWMVRFHESSGTLHHWKLVAKLANS